MFRTTTVYIISGENSNSPPQSDTPKIHTAAESIAGFLAQTFFFQLSVNTTSGETNKTVTRDWATREAAQEWADYIFDNYQVSTTISEVE